MSDGLGVQLGLCVLVMVGLGEGVKVVVGVRVTVGVRVGVAVAG